MPAPLSPRRLDYVDGLRGLASLSVLALHTFDHALSAYWGSRAPDSLLARLIYVGRCGVPLFFLVSAFSLFHSWLQRASNESTPKRNFWIRRALRVLPLWWIAVVAYSWIAPIEPWEFILNVTLLFGFVEYWWNVRSTYVQWSLFVEETFYVGLPLVAEKLREKKAAWIFLLVLIYLHQGWAVLSTKLGTPAIDSFFETFPLALWYYFALGIVLYHYLEKTPHAWVQSVQKPWLANLTAGTALISMLYLPKTFPITALALTALFLCAQSRSNWMGKLCRFPIVKKFGVYCYSIYLFHPLVLFLLEPRLKMAILRLGWNHWPAEALFLVSFPVVGGICLTLGAALYWAIERPIIDWGTRRLGEVYPGKNVSVEC